MARSRASLTDEIDHDNQAAPALTVAPDPDDQAGDADQAPAAETATPAKKTTARKTAKAPAAKKTTSRTPAKKTPAKTPAKKTTTRKSTAKTTPPAEPAEPLRVRAVNTADAVRVSLYMHPDDVRALKIAKIDDGADLNARFRAMVALWQNNARFRAAVDRLAKDAPRGGGF